MVSRDISFFNGVYSLSLQKSSGRSTGTRLISDACRLRMFVCEGRWYGLQDATVSEGCVYIQRCDKHMGIGSAIDRAGALADRSANGAFLLSPKPFA